MNWHSNVVISVTICTCFIAVAIAKNVEYVPRADRVPPAFESVHLLKEDPTSCKSNKDCQNYGLCEVYKGLHFCKCRRGTSGEYCQFIDECIENPGFCGYKTNAKCVYDFILGRANCQCQDKSKKFDFRTMQCRRTCDSYEQCARNACNLDAFSNRFCVCEFSQRGDFCEIFVNECDEQGLECREAGAKCGFNNKKQAQCECEKPREMFDTVTRTCRKCDCGGNFWFCQYVGGEKICTCATGYYASEGACKKCQCSGDNVEGCNIENGKEVCVCRYDTVQKGHTCQKPCSNHNQCQNGGTCQDRVCHCLPKFSGAYCETYDDCTAICGGRPNWFSDDYKCRYNHVSLEPECICSNDRRKFNKNKGRCDDCDCGIDGTCSFNATGDKVCECNEGYKLLNGKCQRCNCGRLSLDCVFNESGKKLCKCAKDYFSEVELCLP